MDIIIESCDFNSLDEFYDLIIEKLNFSQEMEHSADILFNEIVKIEETINLVWLDFKSAQTLLGSGIDEIVDALNEANDESEAFSVQYQ